MSDQNPVLDRPLRRCFGCGKFLWRTPAHIQQYGYGCTRCGNPATRAAKRITWWERPIVARWYLWEHLQAEPDWRWWRHPLESVQGLWYGLFGWQCVEPQTETQEVAQELLRDG